MSVVLVQNPELHDISSKKSSKNSLCLINNWEELSEALIVFGNPLSEENQLTIFKSYLVDFFCFLEKSIDWIQISMDLNHNTAAVLKTRKTIFEYSLINHELSSNSNEQIY